MSDAVREIEEYLAGLPDERQQSLTSLRAMLRETAPQAEEVIYYKMPALQQGEDVLCSYKSQKNYISLYMNPSAVDRHRDALAALDVGKGCIRFKRFEQLPQETIRQILRETAEEASGDLC